MAQLRPAASSLRFTAWYGSGFTQASQKGSHVKFSGRFGDITRTAIVPRHREVAVGTIRSIIRQVGLDPEEFDRL